MAYAMIAGLPVQVGLYTALVPMVMNPQWMINGLTWCGWYWKRQLDDIDSRMHGDQV
jgi:hypothetical protein